MLHYGKSGMNAFVATGGRRHGDDGSETRQQWLRGTATTTMARV